MSSLANQQQNLSFPGLLQVPGGITSTLQQVQDGNGNVTGLSLSSTGASVTTSSTFQASKNGITLTGATARLISDGFGDLPTVKDFGAVGDGVANDYPAFVLANATGQSIYVPYGTYNFGTAFTSSGTAAWIIAPNVQFVGTQPNFERGVWSDYAPDGTIGGNGVNLWRLYDRVLIGDANTGYNGELNGGTTWPSTYGVGYFQAFSQAASFSSFGGIGFAAASQSIDVPAGNDGTIGVAATGINNNPSGKSAWAYYGIAVQTAAAAGTFTVGMELNACTEKTSSALNPFNAASGINFVASHWVGVGGEYPQLQSLICKPISCGLYLGTNSYHDAIAETGNLMARGIVFGADVLTGSDGVNAGRSIAISMAKGQSLNWEFQNGGFTYSGSRISSDVSSLSAPTGLVFNDTGFTVVSISSTPGTLTEQTLFTVAPQQAAVNYIEAQSGIVGARVQFEAKGTDTNIDFSLLPKGTGYVQFGTYTVTAPAATGYISVKDSSGTIRKLLVG